MKGCAEAGNGTESFELANRAVCSVEGKPRGSTRSNLKEPDELSSPPTVRPAPVRIALAYSERPCPSRQRDLATEPHEHRLEHGSELEPGTSRGSEVRHRFPPLQQVHAPWGQNLAKNLAAY